MDLDTVLCDIGEFGRYQKLVLWFILLPSVFPCGFHAYNQLFMAATPKHWCTVPELDHVNEEYVKNISVPLEEEEGTSDFSKCYMFNKSYTSLTENMPNLTNSTYDIISCKNGWSYDHLQYKNTVVMEWNLVCENNFLPTLALILFGAGGLVGNYIFGYIQDGLGRKPSYFIYLLIQCIFGIATAFSTNFVVWTILRVCVGFTIPAILGTPSVLAIELVGPRYRTTVTILLNIAYSLALIFLSITVWLIRDWRQLAIFTTLPFLPLFAFYWLLPESPRWLLSQGKFREAENILSKMAKANGKNFTSSSIARLKQLVERERANLGVRQKYGVTDLFKSRNLRLKTIIITFIWFTNTSVYVGLSYYAPLLGGDEFLNFFLAGAVELPTYIFIWPALERWGRRWSLFASMVIGGMACLATFVVKNDSVVTIGLYCIGKMGISSSFVVLPLMASELYPTVVRGLGMSFSSVVGMLGPVFIPLVNYLGSDMLKLPLVIMGALLVAGGVCSLLLPETLNQHLPQTLEDADNAGLDCFACCTPPQTDTKMGSVHESNRIDD